MGHCVAMRRSGAPAMLGPLLIAAVLLAGCGTSTAPRSSPHPTTVRTYPPVPAGGTDCGITDQMSGWPTTTMAVPMVYSCLSEALDAVNRRGSS